VTRAALPSPELDGIVRGMAATIENLAFGSVRRVGRFGFACVSWCLFGTACGGVSKSDLDAANGKGGSSAAMLAGGSGGSSASGDSSASGGAVDTDGDVPSASGDDGTTATGDEGTTATIGAVSISLAAPRVSEVENLGQRTCQVAGRADYTSLIGNPTQGRTVEDNLDGVHVSCNVQHDPDGSWLLQIGLSEDDAHGREPLSMKLSGFAQWSVTPTASLTFFSPETLQLTSASFPSCTLGPTLEIGDDAVRADFTCPLIADDGDDTSGCRATGTVVAENCKPYP
jgi:hypothetical protein